MKKFLKNALRGSREFCPPEGYVLWSRIEDLGDACGYDAAEQFHLMRQLPDIYPARSGGDPDEIAEEHPMQALAILVGRFLAEYPETVEMLTAAGTDAPKAA